MSSKATGTTGDDREHAWRGLEPYFQAMRDWGRKNEGNCAAAIEANATDITAIVIETARGLLRRMGLVSYQEDAENASQAWMTIVLEQSFRQCDDRAIHPYAFGILNNVCRELLRNARRTVRLPPDFDMADEQFDPFRNVVREELIECVRKEMDSLPPRLRDAIHGQYFEGLSAQEAADRMGISAGAMDLLRYRARDQFRCRLRDCGDQEW